MTSGAERLPGALARRLACWPRAARDLALRWLTRQRQRRHLHAVSDHVLKDIGLSRADIEREARKGFWRE
ncbi:MAG: DUF1127 domain-containing protein [Rhodospirillaceae bacterium]|jgi:uncharacterized protein YjiS (DUF1127 family)|nr:DUF1127 domain-containing protein [Rhodospirillaceae bacterium]